MGSKQGSDIGHGWHSRKHGFYDPGAVSPVGRGGKGDRLVTVENRINDQNSDLYCEHLKNRNAVPIVISGPLGNRANIAKGFDCKSLISWHVNASPDPRADGFALYVHPDRADSRKLAKNIEAALLKTKVLEKYGADYNGIKTDNGLYIIRKPEMPCVLIEDLFLSNIADEILLHNAGYASELTGIVADAVLSHFGELAAKPLQLYYVTWPSSRANQNDVLIDLVSALKLLKLPNYKIHKLADGKLQVIATAKSRDHLIAASERAGYKAYVVGKG